MPGKTGFEVLEALLSKDCMTKVIVMSMYADQAYADRARGFGCLRIYSQRGRNIELDKALRTQEGEFFTSHSVGRATINLMTEQSVSKLDDLTETERRVLRLLAQGFDQQGNWRELRD